MTTQFRLPMPHIVRTFAAGIGAALVALALTAGGASAAAAEPIAVPRVKGLPDEAQRLLNDFEKEANGLRAEAEKHISAQRAAFLSELQQMQTRYTRASNLDAALTIRDLIRSLEATATSGEPRPPDRVERQTVRINAQSPQASPQPASLRSEAAVEEMVRIHSRFPGEIARLGTTTDVTLGSDGKPTQRALRAGDQVEKGQVLAVVLSTEAADKKSELLECQTRLLSAQSALENVRKLRAQSVVSESEVLNAQRQVEADQIALDRVRRTLLTWRIPSEEIEALLKQARDAPAGEVPGDGANDLSWAEIQIRAPLSGQILERNCNVGEIIDVQHDLFKIGTLAATKK